MKCFNPFKAGPIFKVINHHLFQFSINCHLIQLQQTQREHSCKSVLICTPFHWVLHGYIQASLIKCFPSPQHEDVWETVEEYRYTSTWFLILALHGSEWSTSCTGYITTEKEPWYPLNITLGGPQSWSGHFGKEKNFFPMPGFDPQIIQPAARSPHYPSSHK
jgi:hypothetical protein